MSATISSSRFADIIAAARLKKTMQLEFQGTDRREGGPLFSDPSNLPSGDGFIDTMQAVHSAPAQDNITTTDKYGHSITYNNAQQAFIDLASSGKSACLIGAAGTGKTTCMKGTVSSLIQKPFTGILQNHDHKHLPHGVPGIVVCAYTRRATNNIRRNMSEEMKANCLTIHKLLEYGPEYFTVINDDGEERTSMRFQPMRHQDNPLPSEITTIIFEESSMIGTQLYNEVLNALQHKVQIIFLGDIQQLPPVFGPAVLGFKLSELPTIELTEVYRQALESPIIRLAHRILSGKPIPPNELQDWNVPGLQITPWKKKIEAENALTVTEKLFTRLYNENKYDPENDIILIPFNKSYGTTEINKSIANELAKRSDKVVWEVVSGFVKHYFSVGDKVLFDREDAIILDIYPNPSYTGVPPQRESTYLDYWGHTQKSTEQEQNGNTESGEDIDFILGQVAASDEDRVTQSSHHIKLRMMDSDSERTITKAAEVNVLILGYALTIHKSQGSEWDKVFLLFHNSHATMMQRELIYTAVTRAKKDLFIICEPDTFVNAIKSQRIKGDTLEQKALYFRGKLEAGDLQT